VFDLRPVGLALKAGSWYLVDSTGDRIEVRCIDDLRATRLTNRFFTPPHGFVLAEFWPRHVAGTL
jgi:hypothetical protein